MPAWTETLIYALLPWMVLINRLPWIWILVELLVAFLAVLVLHRLGTRFLLRLSGPFAFSRHLVLYGNRSGAVAMFFLATQVVLRSAPDTLPAMALARHLSAIALVVTLTWLAVRCVAAVADTIIEINPAHEADNLQARRIQTQTRVLSRIVMVLVILIGTGAALMTLPLLRQIGTSLLASAGVAGLVVGFAAKPVLGNLIAGLQIALAQPIRLDDVVIIQGEWGVIEEITGTYVVVRIWDQRRLVVPLQWFIENPFQNWTRTNADILGTVFIWVDYRMPIPAMRAEAQRICENAPEWDGRLVETQVVEVSERAQQVRILVSAKDAGHAWHLRARVREEMIDFIQREYPDYLPRLRTDVGASKTGEA